VLEDVAVDHAAIGVRVVLQQRIRVDQHEIRLCAGIDPAGVDTEELRGLACEATHRMRDLLDGLARRDLQREQVAVEEREVDQVRAAVVEARQHVLVEQQPLQDFGPVVGDREPPAQLAVVAADEVQQEAALASNRVRERR